MVNDFDWRHSIIFVQKTDKEVNKEMKKDIYCKRLLHIAGKQIAVYPSAAPDMPVIYLNTFTEEGDNVYQSLRNMNCPDFTLVAISGLVWNNDMAPWDIPPISKGDTPCTGGADDYLRLLTDEIIPRAEEQIPGQALWRGLAGYSLGGLFALYSIYQTELFSRIASVSGSLWFPGFQEYIFSHEIKSNLQCLYFSLGDKECQTKNPYLKTVQKHTEDIETFFAQHSLDTVLQINPGNHFKNAVQRTASGIAWILNK